MTVTRTTLVSTSVTIESRKDDEIERTFDVTGSFDNGEMEWWDIAGLPEDWNLSATEEYYIIQKLYDEFRR